MFLCSIYQHRLVCCSFPVLTLIGLMKDLHHMHLNHLVLLEKENAQATDFPRLKLILYTLFWYCTQVHFISDKI